MSTKKIKRSSLAVAAIVCLLSIPYTPGLLYGQGGGGGGGGGGGNINIGSLPAGVVIDAQGVLRTHIVRDPGLRMTRGRIAAAKKKLAPDLARPSKLRKVSLNRLEAALARRLAAGEAPTDEMLFLAGLTRVKYVFYYPETKDIVIAGPAEGFMLDLTGRPIGFVTGRSVLQLEDLITSLRAFPPAEQGRRANVIVCSIDPTREGLSRLQQFLARVGGSIRRGQEKRFAKGVRDALGMQNVTIKGVPRKSHFAQVLVEADYRMKLIGIGLERPPVKITSWVSIVSPSAVARNALQRWYFTPNYECVRVSEDALAMELVGDGVKLISEDEMVRGDGVRVAARRVQRASQRFVTSFTEKYPELAQKSPVYAQLRNLIDMSIAAAFIQQNDYYSAAEWELGVFADEKAYPVLTHPEPRQVESAVNLMIKGSRVMTPIGGGVHIQPLQALREDKLLKDEQDKVKYARTQVNFEKLDKEQWWWD